MLKEKVTVPNRLSYLQNISADSHSHTELLTRWLGLIIFHWLWQFKELLNDISYWLLALMSCRWSYWIFCLWISHLWVYKCDLQTHFRYYRTHRTFEIKPLFLNEIAPYCLITQQQARNNISKLDKKLILLYRGTTSAMLNSNVSQTWHFSQRQRQKKKHIGGN